ncbi:MAG: hypothetical protein RSF82_03710 [Angelakisella sp.]
MRKFKQVFNTSRGYFGLFEGRIDLLLNDFMSMLPMQGKEVVSVTYAIDSSRGRVESAIVEYMEEDKP